MKFFTSFAILALSAVASASPVNTSGSVEKRAGPSGQVITPQGGQYFSSGGGVELEYTRVNGEQGYYTEYIDVDLVDQNNGEAHRVATGLTSSGKEENIHAWFLIPESSGASTVSPPFKFRMRIREYQIGSDGRLIDFQSAAPLFNVSPLGGSSCTGFPPGDCRNTQ